MEGIDRLLAIGQQVKAAGKKRERKLAALDEAAKAAGVHPSAKSVSDTVRDTVWRLVFDHEGGRITVRDIQEQMDRLRAYVQASQDYQDAGNAEFEVSVTLDNHRDSIVSRLVGEVMGEGNDDRATS